MRKCAEAHKGLAAVEACPNTAPAKPAYALYGRSCPLVGTPFILTHLVREALCRVRHICVSHNTVYNHPTLC